MQTMQDETKPSPIVDDPSTREYESLIIKRFGLLNLLNETDVRLAALRELLFKHKVEETVKKIPEKTVRAAKPRKGNSPKAPRKVKAKPSVPSLEDKLNALGSRLQSSCRQIAAILAEGPAHSSLIASSLGITESAAQQRLRKGTKYGIFRKTQPSVYALDK